MKKLLSLILFLLLASPAWAATYYVSNSGSDGANGTSTSTPWAHHPWSNNAASVSAATVLAGDDIVCMAYGSIWYNTTLTANDAGTEGHQITTTACSGFGTGANPIITTHLDPTTITWINLSGTVYYATLAESKNVVWNTTQLTASTADCGSIESNTYKWASSTTGTCVSGNLYINVGGVPGSTILAARRDNVINNTGSYHTFSNLTLQLSNTDVTYQSARAAIIYDTVTIRWFKRYGTYYYNGTGTANAVTNSAIYNSTYIASTAGIYDYNTPTLSVTGNEIYGAAIGVSLWTADSLVLTGNYIHNNGTGVYPGGTGSGVFIWGGTAGANISRNRVDQNYINLLHTVTAGTGANLIAYNLVTNATLNSIDVEGDFAGANPQLIYNNTIYHSPSASNNPVYTGHGIAIQSNGKNAKIGNNIIVVDAGGVSTNCNGISVSDTYNAVWLDYNDIYLAQAYGAIGKLVSSSYTTLATWQAAVQADAKLAGLDGVQANAESHSISINPLFVSASDFHLQPGSPAINVGVDVGLTVDYEGKPVPATGPVDIGAYQHGHLGHGMTPGMGMSP